MSTATKKCPMCAEQIPLASVTCEYCGARFEITGVGYCQDCHQVRAAETNGRCKVCHNVVLDLRLESKLINEQEPVSPSGIEPEITTTKRSCLVLSLLGMFLACVGMGAYLWLGQNNLPAISSFFATPSPTARATFTPTRIPTVITTNSPDPAPTATQKPTSLPQPTVQRPSSGLLAPSEVKAIRECTNLGPSTRPGANRFELTVFITWKDNATNELGYIIYQFGTEIARVDANVTRYAVSQQSRFGIYISEEYGVVAWNDQGKSEKIAVTATFSCP